MVQFSLPYSLLLIILGSVFIIYPQKIVWLRKALKKGDTRNISMSTDKCKIYRLFGIIGLIVGLFGVSIHI
ncbi:hypothetical protein SY89_00469 [Halolamina pelagica]|uniref:DUF6199 domain-containing protein n=1 Tax=Halolamina pelagica TaxID=699431 RepID=A0A0P7GMF9_9EURY|nr:hypothetical protein SY89_00469 [Halolamina pelagica]